MIPGTLPRIRKYDTQILNSGNSLKKYSLIPVLDLFNIVYIVIFWIIYYITLNGRKT